MFKNPILRIVLGLPAAAIIVYGLFIGMGLLIAQDFVPNEDEETRIIERITPEAANEEVRSRARAKPRRLQTADKPPPPPKLSARKSDIDLPTPDIQGAAPTEIRVDRVQSLDINPPVVTYPNRALERGTEGDCQVRFDVDVRGRPYNVQADCTNSVFKREAERAVSRVEFAPKIVSGEARERRNVVYPLVFNLDD